jgi:Dolichyl-phosphate-mannose-protein mannosyltransferase
LTIGPLISCLPVVWAVAIGFLVAAVLWPDSLNSRESILIRSFLAPGLGFGLVSSVTFLVLTFFQARRSSLLVVMLLLSAVLILAFVRRAPRATFTVPPELRVSVSRFGLLLGAAVGGVLVLDAVAFLLQLVFEPSGGWDTWAIWNLRARFLVRADQLTQGFGEALRWSHPDYPLLIPGTVAYGWLLLGTESKLVPMLTAATFTAATLGLLAASLTQLRGWTVGLIATAALAATPNFIHMGAMQQADVPLSFFFLATLVLLALADGDGAAARLSVLAGLILGCALWTKNEAWVFAAAVLTVWGVAWLARRRRLLAGFVGGFVPFLLLVVFFRLRLGVSTEYIDAQRTGQARAHLFDWDRYQTIGKWFVRQSLEFGQWKFAVPVVLLLYALWTGVAGTRETRRTAGRIAVCLCLTLLGYFYVYLTGPYELNWWLKSSLDRLFMQLWPSVLFCVFLVLGPDHSAHPAQEQSIPKH